MKTILFVGCLMVLLVCCGFQPAYAPVAPRLPLEWEEILGNPHWRVEWMNNEGKWQSWEGKGTIPELKLMQEWANPVLAWPYWPEKGLNPGIFRPAGAIFPWDASGNTLILSWEAGIDANFWKELAANSELQKNSGTPRLPWLFDWPRFRALFSEGGVGEGICEDPWLADWQTIAQKTVESGYDKRRIKEAARTKVIIPVSDIPNSDTVWAGNSPFAKPIAVLPGESLHLKAGEKNPETWVSSTGQIRCQKGAWVFIPWP